jgi:hypothetical protein
MRKTATRHSKNQKNLVDFSNPIIALKAAVTRWILKLALVK